MDADAWGDAADAFLSETEESMAVDAPGIFEDMESALEEDENVGDSPADPALPVAGPKKRGRPRGTFGSKHFRDAAKRVEAQDRESAADDGPGGAAMPLDRLAQARAERRRRQLAHAESQAAASASLQDAGPSQKFFRQESAIWEAVAYKGSLAQRCLRDAACWSFQQQSDTVRESNNASFLSSKAIPMMSNKALQAFMLSSGQDATRPKADVARSTRELAAAGVYSSGLLWSGLLSSIRQKLTSGQWQGILCIKKSRPPR